MINGVEEKYSSIYEKIDVMVNNDIVIPIISDFLIYNKQSDVIKKYNPSG